MIARAALLAALAAALPSAVIVPTAGAHRPDRTVAATVATAQAFEDCGRADDWDCVGDNATFVTSGPLLYYYGQHSYRVRVRYQERRNSSTRAVLRGCYTDTYVTHDGVVLAHFKHCR